MIEVLVLGATGTTGSRVAAGLMEAAATVRAATRTPRTPGQVRFDWTEPAGHTAALQGVDAVFLVAPIGEADPVPLVEPFLAEALRLGVRRVVLLGSSAVPEGGPALGELHALVHNMIPEWTVLRPSWFMQNFTGAHPVAQGVRAGEIVTATGDGRVGFVDADDIATVAVRALTDPTPHNTEHLITGPEALNYADAAAIITEITHRPVRHRAVDPTELVARLSGIPMEFAEILAALDASIAAGAEDRVTDTVPRLTGSPARSFRAFADKEMR
ncbi:MAG TPA: NAD(P)H-binding protein [Pseudonocardiaceae bacterium]|jgi:uncharacterized protein YbjT (DUF2867 family)|nr:NAD(P)H-binding protein [Pseudonocardiaceae bacterium]